MLRNQARVAAQHACSSTTSLHACADVAKTHLQERPIDDDDVADDKGRGAPVDLSVVAEDRLALDPRLARSDAKHTDDGAREVAKVLRGGVGEEGDAKDGVEADDDGHDEEGVEHGDQRGGESVDDGTDRAQASEDAEDAEGAHEAEDGDGGSPRAREG